MKTEKLDLNKEVIIQVKLTYSFVPADHLPDDYDGTREDVVNYFREDIAQNFDQWVSANEIHEHTQEVSEERERLEDAAPELLSALYGLVGCLDNGSVIIDGFDRRATEEDYRIARAAIAKATGEPVMAA
jgi:hypothetical protein